MKIQCILLRKGGTHVEIGGANYHFAPDASGRHVANVDDEDHIARFLGIPEAYRVVIEAAKAVDASSPQPRAEDNEQRVDDGQSQAQVAAQADGLEALDKIELTKRYIAAFDEPPPGALTKPRLIDAIREKAARA